jgi:hypothetical protein
VTAASYINSAKVLEFDEGKSSLLPVPPNIETDLREVDSVNLDLSVHHGVIGA